MGYIGVFWCERFGIVIEELGGCGGVIFLLRLGVGFWFWGEIV